MKYYQLTLTLIKILTKHVTTWSNSANETGEQSKYSRVKGVCANDKSHVQSGRPNKGDFLNLRNVSIYQTNA